MAYEKFCFIKHQGYEPCGCTVETSYGPEIPCRAGIAVRKGRIYRLIYDIVLSRPEDYLSVYQSGCNHNCLKCHSWYFTQRTRGYWHSPQQLLGGGREVSR